MDHMLHSNVMLFPSGDKMVVMTIVDADFIKSALPESHKNDNISFTLATTRVGIDGQITIKINPETTVESEEWAAKCEVDTIKGLGIAGIVTSPIWFCQKVRDLFHGLM